MRGQRSKKTVILSILIGVMLIACFGLVLHLIENHGLKDEQFGDRGEWGDEEADPIYITLAGKSYLSNDNISTYMIAGTDAGGNDLGEGFNGEMADFILLLVVDNTTQKYAFYQIDRNSMTDVPVLNEDGIAMDYAHQQITTAHWYGKTAEDRNNNLANALVTLMGGLMVDRYYVMNMEDMDTVNDAIGGVTVTIPVDMTVVDPAFKEGATVHLEGDQAEKFVRARYDLKDGTNAARMERQTQYMQNAYSMIIGQLRENPEYVNDLYDGLNGVFQTDGNGKDLSKVTNQLIQYENEGIIKFNGVTREHDTLGIGEVYEETVVNETSILNGLRKVMNLEEYEDNDDEGVPEGEMIEEDDDEDTEE